MALPSAEMHWGDIILPTMVHPAGALGGVTSIFGVDSANSALKLPVRSADVGMVRFWVVADCRILFHSSPAKKNNLCLMIGPPTFHPKSLNLKVGFTTGEVGVAFSLEATLTASNLSLRRYSN